MSSKILEIIGVKFDKIFLINLDTRKDRLKSLMEAEPYLEKMVTRIPAINGKTLIMNRFIYNLFKQNQFHWKKSVIGCNLSHMTVWSKIIQEPGRYFLVLEDDVRFKKDWLHTLNVPMKHVPFDADILYLGGVLPPNKTVLPECTEYGEYWCKIKPNTFFSPTPLPVFHFCAYSYILTKQGATKLLAFLTNSELKSYTISDQLLGSHIVGLNKYFINPLVSYCFQENDPVYLNSQFNDLHRKDTFDSDIWNNTECFTDFDQFNSIQMYHMGDDLYEKSWLREFDIDFKKFSNADVLPNSWFIVQRPHLAFYNTYFKLLDDKKVNFNVLHLSDELCIDDISFYDFPACKKVVRNYIRNSTSSKVQTIPLGFHYKSTNNRVFADREFTWSFHGTNWFNRKEQLEILSEFKHNCHFTPNWNHATMTQKDEYLMILENSKFCPILRGNNVETFRLYECLEAGTIPLYIRNDGDELFWDFISRLGLICITWDNIISIIRDFLENPSTETYRQTLLTNWKLWKQEIKSNLLSCV